jgi:hypothetical protein
VVSCIGASAAHDSAGLHPGPLGQKGCCSLLLVDSQVPVSLLQLHQTYVCQQMCASLRLDAQSHQTQAVQPDTGTQHPSGVLASASLRPSVQVDVWHLVHDLCREHQGLKTPACKASRTLTTLWQKHPHSFMSDPSDGPCQVT